MNSITPYEIKIAEKLEQLPVPDMADSIWASIELQLDADLSSENTDDTSSQDATKGKPGLGKGFYLSIITAIIIIAILLYKNNKQSKKNNEQPRSPKTEMTKPIIDNSQPVIEPLKNNNQEKNAVNKKDSTAIPFIPGNRISFDSTIRPVFPLNKIDSSAAVLKNKPQLPSFDSSFINSPLNKPKGVKGISDSDYRIFGKKDSLKRGG